MSKTSTRYRMLAVSLSNGLSAAMIGTFFMPSQAASRVYHGNTTYVRELRTANYLLQTGKFQDAEASYMAMLKRNPNNTKARGGLALAQAELFKLDPSEKNAKMVLAKDPRNVMAHTALGVIYRNRTASLDMAYRGRRDDYLAASAKELEKAVELDPNSPEAHTQLGVTYRFQGKYDQAQDAFEKALDLDHNFSEALLNQGIMRMERGDVSGAKSIYNRAIKLNSRNHMAHYRMGEALVQEGDYHNGLRHLNNALALDKNNAAIMSKMAEAYDKQGNSAAAVANYKKAMHANPSFMPAYVGLANLLDSRGDGEMAMAELKSALNVNPNYAPARNQLGRLALTVDKPDQALQYYKESLKQNPNDSEAIQGISQALTVVAQKTANWSQAMGQDSDLVTAEQAVQEALRLNPNDLRLHLANLRISELAGKPSRSEAELQQIVSVTPRNESEEMMQGEAYLALGRYDEADRIFQGLMNKSSKNADKLLVIGDTLKANGDLARAKDAYKMASAAEPGNLKAERGVQRIEKAEEESEKTLRLAKALNNWKQKGSSVDFYEEALAKNPRQPEARLALAKLYEKYREYNKAATSYQHYLGLNPNMDEKDKQYYQKKITRLKELAQKNISAKTR